MLWSGAGDRSVGLWLDAGLPELAGWGRWSCAAADAGRTGLAFGSGGGSVLVDSDGDLDKVEGRV